MDILKSIETDATVVLMIFSGRPDPVWTISKDKAIQIATSWSFLEQQDVQSEKPESLGYRGCAIFFTPSLRLFLFNETANLLNHNTVIEKRVDPDRQIEQLVLSSAPENLKLLIEGIHFE